MTTPIRILRAKARAADPSHFTLTMRQQEREERILKISQHLLADEGRHNITHNGLARALRISRPALDFHFVDVDALLGELIRRHLRALARELGNIPPNAPNRKQQCRAAYLAYTRTPLGGFTEAHLLLVRDRHTLPLDELESIELTRYGLGQLLAGDLAVEALALLDTPGLDAARVEASLAPRPAAPELVKIAAPPAPVKIPAAPEPPREPDPVFDPPDGKKPGDWVYSCGIPLQAAPPHQADTPEEFVRKKVKALLF